MSADLIVCSECGSSWNECHSELLRRFDRIEQLEAENGRLRADNEAMERQLDYLNETPWRGHPEVTP